MLSEYTLCLWKWSCVSVCRLSYSLIYVAECYQVKWFSWMFPDVNLSQSVVQRQTFLKWVQESGSRSCLVSVVLVDQMFHCDREVLPLFSCTTERKEKVDCRLAWFYSRTRGGTITAPVWAWTYTWLAALLSCDHSSCRHVDSANCASWLERNCAKREKLNFWMRLIPFNVGGFSDKLIRMCVFQSELLHAFSVHTL